MLSFSWKREELQTWRGWRSCLKPSGFHAATDHRQVLWHSALSPSHCAVVYGERNKGLPCTSHNLGDTTRASHTWDPVGNSSQCKAQPKRGHFNGAVKFFCYGNDCTWLQCTNLFNCSELSKLNQKSLSSCLHERSPLLSALSYVFVRPLVCKNY